MLCLLPAPVSVYMSAKQIDKKVGNITNKKKHKKGRSRLTWTQHPLLVSSLVTIA